MSTSMFFRLCSVAPRMRQRFFAVARARVRRHRMESVARKVRPVSDSGLRESRRERARGHQFAAQPARARAEIDHVIGALDGFRVVLHHQHRVAHIAQMRERFEQAAVVARMQADGRFVEHVQHAAQLRADLRGQPDALRFAAGKRGAERSRLR
jgi:hypothetical protein